MGKQLRKEKTERKKQVKRKKRKLSPKRLVAIIFFAAALAAFLGMLGYLFLILNGEKLLQENIAKMNIPEASIIYDKDGNEVYRLYSENRDLVKFEEIPKQLLEAVVATEDQRFYEHSGLDPWAIGRALLTDIMHGSFVQGGSTITQQLAKNLFLTSEKTFLRKATEASMAVALENNYSKDEILEMYLNTIFFGHRAYGVKAAAQVYFGKEDLMDLELWEMATLAAIPKGPSIYNPISHPERSLERRKVVLRLMYEQGYITQEEMEQAAAVEYKRPAHAQVSDLANQAYIDYVLQEAQEMAGITEEQFMLGGYRIYTALDQQAQRVMEQSLSNADWYPKDGPEQKVESGMVIMDHTNGQILAMFGGRDYVPRGTNHATEKHQPGSSFKPVISFAPALETREWHPDSLLVDEQLDFGGYKPRNYNNRYQGRVTMADAVKHSINVPAVWLLQQIGIDTALDFAKQLGIEMAPEDRNLSIALGGLTYGVSAVEMAQAYTAFANQGIWNKGYTITRILDRNQRTVYEPKPESREVMSAENAWYLTEMLQAAVDSGTGRNARMNRPVAGKTGTAQYDQVPGGNKDVWFVGYTPEWTAAVWMGFPRTDQDHYLTSGSGTPASMFADVMSKALEGREVVAFKKPEGVGVQQVEQAPSPIDDLAVVYEEVMGCAILTWSEPAEGLVYKVYRATADEAEVVELTSSTSSLVKDCTVMQTKTYTYYVTAMDQTTQLESSASNEVSVEIPELDPIVNWEDFDSPSDEEEQRADEEQLEEEQDENVEEWDTEEDEGDAEGRRERRGNRQHNGQHNGRDQSPGRGTNPPVNDDHSGGEDEGYEADMMDDATFSEELNRTREQLDSLILP